MLCLSMIIQLLNFTIYVFPLFCNAILCPFAAADLKYLRYIEYLFPYYSMIVVKK